MSLDINSNFARLLDHLKAQGKTAQQRTEDVQEYRDFLSAFPLSRLKELTLDQYCVGKGDGASFCWWLEQGLRPALGRYMPGTSRGHILYFLSDGTLYKNRLLQGLSDEDALRYTLAIQSTIAGAKPDDLLWVDDDKEIFRRADVEPLVTVGDGRKLRLLACYLPSDTLPISSSIHLGHYLKALGCPDQQIPDEKKPVARMLKLREYYLLARESVSGLSPYGFMRGLYSEELGLAPAKKGTDDDGALSASAYLLTWNPANYKLGGDKGVTLGDEVSWTCHSKQPQPGDWVYLVRVGQEPRGLVARGVVIQGAHEAPDWRDANKTRNYIRFRVEEHRPDCVSGLLPMVLLNKAFAQQRWNPQSSGVVIPQGIAEVLESLWQNGDNKHSLRQYIEWSSADGKESRPKWLKSYRAVTELARALSEQQAELDQAAMRSLWLERDNGVSSLRQGVLSKAEWNAEYGKLTEMTRLIMTAPTAESFQQILGQWKTGVKTGDFSMNRPAMISRVFAAFSPEQFTSILKTDDCQFLLQGLKSQFQLNENGPDDLGWCGLNQQIKASLHAARVEETPVLESNIALWQLLETLRGVDVSDDVQETQGTTEMKDLDIPLNQILFGPPGTGKTYATINHALTVLDPEFLASNAGRPEGRRERLKTRFDQLAKDDRVRFVTFHQSFSYEDFVEGLRAGCNDEGQLEYRVESGVFKLLCEDAKRDSSDESATFEAAFERLKEHLESKGDRIIAQTVRSRRFAFEYVGGETFRIFPEESQEQKLPYRAALSDIRRLYFTGDKSNMHNASYVQGILQYLLDECGLPELVAELPADWERQKYVLIIDEINRGNVSRIFGELITLIEESKRAGRNEQLAATLPYSKERFSVPDNVYLIGTMNTADRSLAGLDIALRRRFTFTEMPPKPELLDGVNVEGVNVGQLLRVMNQRIEVLLDRDHCLGHAYFMSLKDVDSLDNLERIFRNQLLPLLQEYFFEDWQRIQWILNDHRKAAQDQFVRKAVRTADDLFGTGADVPQHDMPWQLNDDAFNRVEAYLGIIDHQAKPSALTSVQEATDQPYKVRLLSSGSIEVLHEEQLVSPVKPILRKLADKLSVPTHGSTGTELNTRSLGRKVIDAIQKSAQ
ncbi:MAG: AAA family ATPase [Halopseudomonas sabulinigri]